MWSADHGGHPGLHGVLDVGGVIAEGLDGEAQHAVVRGTGHGEGVPPPAVLAFQEQHRELTGHETHGRPDRGQADLRETRPDAGDLCDLIVVQGQEVRGDGLAVAVDRHPDPADDHVGPAQQPGPEHRGIEQPVHEPGGDEQPGHPVHRTPAFVVAQQPPRPASTPPATRLPAAQASPPATTRRAGRGSTERHRGRIAHTTSASSP